MNLERDKNRKKNTRFFAGSILGIILLCALVFTFLVYWISNRSQDTLWEVGRLYMSGMSQRIAGHFDTILTSRFSLVNGVLENTPPQSSDDPEAMKESLVESAKIREMDYLALLCEDGSREVLYGNPLTLMEEEDFVLAIKGGEKKVTMGIDGTDDRIMLLGVPAEYPLAGGGTSVGLVAGVTLDDVKEILSLDEDETLVFSHVILRDGTFAIRSSDAVRENYFDRMREVYDVFAGKTPDQYAEELKAAIEKEEDYSVEFMVDGERRYLYCTALPFCDWYLVTVMPYGELDQIIAKQGVQMLAACLGCCMLLVVVILGVFARYVYLIREQMRKLHEAQQMTEAANRAKSEFLSNMSHDIRTPMNAIVGMTAIALANLDKPEQVEECLKKVTVSGKHLLGLINDVLDMSKIESGKMTMNLYQVSIREVFDSMVAIMQPEMKARGQKFDVAIHDISAEHVLCDGVRLSQVLINLLSNAVKFTPEGGSISVALWETPSPRGEGYVRLCFRVRDTGIGMTEEFQQKLFDAFIREDSTRVNKTEGTGLGMAITKYIIDTMGGTIDVKSTPGEGTEFTVAVEFETLPAEEEEMSLEGWHVLVVDDDRDSCRGAVASLESMGAKTEWALDGKSAVKIVGSRREKGDGFDAILLDWKLPGMDGIETAKEIRHRFGQKGLILLVSAYDLGDLEERAKEAGIYGFLSKPLFKSTLYYGLKRHIGELEAAETVETKKADFTGRRVLVAEDNELNWEVAEALLEELGLELEWAENGSICVEKFQNSPVGYYDAVLMDLRMPVMNGYEAADAIRASERADHGIPIIAMTADVFVEDVERCMEHGMNAHTAKPVNLEEITGVFSRIWEEA